MQGGLFGQADEGGEMSQNQSEDGDDKTRTGGSSPAGLTARRKPILTRRYEGMIILALILLFLFLGLFKLVPDLLTAMQDSKVSPEILYTLWLVLGALSLIGILMAVALISRFIIGSRAVPGSLGLPEGSISAVLALMLLLIFASSTIFLFSQIRAGEGDGFVSSGLSAEALRSLPQDRILEVNVENPTVPDAAARTYQVRLVAVHTDSIEFGRTTALTIGTLLTAVSGFYFGERATRHAVSASTRRNTFKSWDR
jgi:hypothetical protein